MALTSASPAASWGRSLAAMGCLLVLGCASLAHAAEGGPLVIEASPLKLKPPPEKVLFVPVIDEAITLDGKIEEPAWQRAAVVREWQNHGSGGPAELDAELKVLASREFVYVACTLRGTRGLELTAPTPGATGTPGTPGTPGKDEYAGTVLELFFDPDAEGRTKAQIVTNPLGLRYDAFDSKPEWTGTWKSAGRVEDDSWTVEVAVPVSEMKGRVPGEVSLWRGNFGIYFHREGEQLNSWTGGWGSPATDYGTLYFGSREEYERSLKPELDLFLDRVVYDVRDTTAVALARLNAAGRPLNDLALELSVRRGDKIELGQKLPQLAGADLDCTLNLQNLSEGDYTLRATLLEKGVAVASADRSFSKRKRSVQPEPVRSGKISIRVHPQRDLAGVRWPITTGVPFAQGSLDSVKNVRLLDPSGKEVPVQASVRSTWGRRGPVQWLGLDFVPTLGAGEQVYTLEYGPEVKPRQDTSKLKVDQTDDHITIDTGPLKFTVDRKRFALISAASLDGKPVITPNDRGGLSLVDHEGHRYTAANDRAVEVTVEEHGPVRATIRAKGWYVKEGSDGSRTSVELPTDRLCLFTVRISAFAGSPLVKLAVSTTLTQDTTKVRLRELTIGLPVQPGAIRAGDVPLAEGAYLLQDRWDRAVDAAGKEHPRSEGSIEAPGVRVAVRRFWQLFPKEIGYADGVLTIHPWPANGRDVFTMDEQVKMSDIYKLRYAHHGKELDFNFPAAYTKALDDRLAAQPKAFGVYYKDMSYANAQGLTIHNDLLLSFGEAIGGAQLAKLANDDPHALPDPEYLCGTNVFGPILHADPQFAELEETYKRGFTHFLFRKEPANEYGQFIFGNTHTLWDYHGKHAHIHRTWSNNHYLVPRLPMVQYARTGDPVWINLPGGGRDITNTVRDIATVNYVTDERRFNYHQLGAMYHVKGFAPWAGDAHVAAHPICVDHLIYDYYLFGNRRSLDALHNWLQGLKDASPGGYPTREGMTTMAEMIEAYRLTWDPALVELIERFRVAILKQPAGEPEFPSWDYHPLLCMRDYEFSGDPRMLEAFRELAAGSGTGVNQGGTMHYAGLLAVIDNDPAALEPWTRRLYRDAISVVDRPGEYGDGLVSNTWYTYVYPAHKYPYTLKAMKRFGLRLQRPELTRPAPVATADGRTLIVVNEVTDQAIPVTIAFAKTPEKKIAASVFREDGEPVAQAERPAETKDNRPLTLTIPADGCVGQYLIEIRREYEYEPVLWPVTPLAQEVALLPAGQEILMTAPSEGLRLHLAPPSDAAAELTMRTRSSSAMALELFDAKGTMLSRTTNSEYVGGAATIAVPAGTAAPLSIYVTGEARIKLPGDTPWTAALSADALFKPAITAAPR